MKPRLFFAVLMISIILFSACSHSTHPSKSIPPGQAKKISGSKSAKPYAPGQQKKKQ